VKKLVFLLVFLLAFVLVGVASAAPSVVSTTQNSATVEGLDCGSKYRFEIRKYNADGSLSSTTTSVDVQTKRCPDTRPPSAPQELAATGVTQTSISVSWSASTDDVGVAGYDLYRGGAKVDSTNATSYTYAGLSCGTSYTLAVAAFDAAGNESNRAQATVSAATSRCPDTRPPSAPAGLVQTGANATSAALSWQPSTDDVGVVGYGIYVGTLLVASTSETSFLFTGLPCASTYGVAVDAVDAAHNRSPRTSFVVTTSACPPDTTPPSLPQGLTMTAATESTITLDWDASTDNVGVTGYALYRGGARVATTSDTAHTYTALACGTSYTLAVAAFDAAGNESNRAQATTVRATLACPVPTPPPPPPSPSEPFRNTFATDGPLTGQTTDVSEYGWVIVNMGQHAGYKAAADAAGTTLGVYQCMSSAREPGRWGTSAGITWEQAQAHPEWWLRDQNGALLEWAPWPGTFQMDIGNPEYQRIWVDNVIARAKAGGWKAVAIDNANIDPAAIGYFKPGQQIAKYPTTAAFVEATRSFLAYVGPRLKAAGIVMLPNIQALGDFAALMQVYKSWVPYTGGVIREHWMRWPGDSSAPLGGSSWTALIEQFEEVQRLGGAFATGTHSGGSLGQQAVRYGRASFLIGWQGVQAAAFGGGSTDKSWMLDIGSPVEARRTYATNVWGKKYSGGLALANIGTSLQTVNLGGSYRHTNGSVVTTVTLAGTDGIVLRNP
jgi:chitodextrinase